MKIANRKAGERYLSPIMLIVWIIVAIAVMIGVVLFFNAFSDVREIEANILATRILNCISGDFSYNELFGSGSSLNIYELGFDIYDKCSLNKDSFVESDDYYFKLNVIPLDSENVTRSISGGKDFEVECAYRNVDGSPEKNFPQCVTKNLYVLDKETGKILSIKHSNGVESKMIMQIKNKNKKAALGSTMTWIPAIIIIVIALVFYFAFMLGVFTSKGRAEIDISSYDYGSQTIASDNLVGVLHSKIEGSEFKDKDLSVSDALFKSLDIYWDYLDDINQLYASGGGARVPSEKIALNRDIENEIRKDIETKLDKICDRYTFESPNIKIDKRANKGRDIQTEMMKFTDFVIVRIPYKNQLVEIKYQQLKNCFENV